MMKLQERRAAFKNYRVEIMDDGRIYAVVRS